MPKIIRNEASVAAADDARSRRRRTKLAILGLLALSATTVGLTTAAAADTIQIPATTFVGRSDVQNVGDVLGGTVTNIKGVFYAPVPFQTDGDSVCSFALVHRDNDTDSGIVARLMKKKITIGGNPFTEILEMAALDTTAAGTTTGIAKLKTRHVKQRVLDLEQAFYFVELTVQSTLLEVLGMQIDVEPACP